MIIYNISKYVSENSNIVPITNGDEAGNNRDDSVLLLQTGGADTSRGIKVDHTLQFLSRSKNKLTAAGQIQIIDELLANRFMITLPEVRIGDVVYGKVEVAQILPLQVPSYIGADENTLHEWTLNFMITVKR